MKVCPSLVRGNNDPQGKRLRARNTCDHNSREMHNKHDEPDGEHNANSDSGKETHHPFECAVIVPKSQ